MFNKIYEKITLFIKENYKFLLFLLAFTILINIPLPYYIYSGGGIDDLSERFQIEDAHKINGSYNLSYVTELRATVLSYALSYVIPSWEREKMSSYQINDEESFIELSNRSKLELNLANQAAVKVAYEKALKTFDVVKEHYYIYSKTENSENEFMVGDEILEVDGKAITSFDSLGQIVSSSSEGEKLSIKVLRNGKEKEISAKVLKDSEGQLLLGILLIRSYEYQTDPKITFQFKANEGGPSAGLMTTLAIYDSLTEEDLANGRRIAGTGTISEDGSIGSIGGVNYKLMGAVKKKADIFLVPMGENYEECQKLKKEKNYSIEIIGVETFDDAVAALENHS